MSHQEGQSNGEESEDDLKAEFEDYYKRLPLSEDVTFGFWKFKGPRLQSLANKKVLIIIFGLTGCCFSSPFAYFNGTITTLEKRFKIPTKITGIILIGNDITKVIPAVVLSYYGSRGHRPRWAAVGIFLIAVFCFMNALPHFIYGSGIDALQLTLEYGADFNGSSNYNATVNHQKNYLCSSKSDAECDVEDGSLVPPTILFVSQLIAGVGTSLYHTLSFPYLDDNIKKSKSPAMLSFTHFVRMFGPAMGYGIVSICLKFYIDPYLTPTIDNTDPRWLGAWWVGWLILGAILTVFSIIIFMLPKELPRAAARRQFLKQKLKSIEEEEVTKTSFKDLLETLKCLWKNKVFFYTVLSSIFCIFGYAPFWVYLPKYIEVQYNKSASTASFVTGTTGLIFAGIGILLGGIGVQKIKPKARSIALWNTVIDLIFMIGIISYSFLGCAGIDNQIPTFASGELNTDLTCNANCDCDYVKFSPVCDMVHSQTYISACHAGCTQQTTLNNGTTIYGNCSCVLSSYENTTEPSEDGFNVGNVVSGPCIVDCQYQFYAFIVVKCLIKMFGAMSRVTFFLVAVRCVQEKDKSISLGVSLSLVGLFALLPSPIFFGYIIDSACLVWGKTCTGQGNCWFFNTALLRDRLTYASAAFVFVGVIFDFLVYKHIKGLSIFDEPLSVKLKPKEEIALNDKLHEEKGV